MTNIRPAHGNDAAALVALGTAIGSEEGAWLLTSTGWRSVAEEDGVLAGRLSLARNPHPASHHVADLGLMVAAGHRRRGVGRMLLEQAVAWASEANVRKLELHVFPWNEPAMKLYETFGFEREGVRREHYRRDGEYVDAILMAYRLPPPTS